MTITINREATRYLWMLGIFPINSIKYRSLHWKTQIRLRKELRKFINSSSVKRFCNKYIIDEKQYKRNIYVQRQKTKV